MNNKNILKNNFIWNLIGNIIYSFSQFFIIVILAKFGTVSSVGLFSIALALSAPILMLSGLQLRIVYVTDQQQKSDFSIYFGLRLFTSIISFILLCVYLFTTQYNSTEIIFMILLFLSKVIDTISDIVHGEFQKNERFDLISKSKIVKSFVIIIFLPMIVILTKDIIFVGLLLFLVSLLTLIIYDLKKLKKFTALNKIYDKDSYLKIIKIAFPLGLVLMLTSLNTNLPRLFIEKYIGIEELGYYTAISNFIVIGQIFVSALTQTSVNSLSKLYFQKYIKEFKILLFKGTLFGFILGLCGLFLSIFLGEFLLTIIYSNDYGNYKELLNILMVSAIFLYSSAFLGAGLSAARVFKVQPLIEGIILIVTFILILVFIGNYSLNGIGYALVISAVLQFIIKGIFIYKILNRINREVID